MDDKTHASRRGRFFLLSLSPAVHWGIITKKPYGNPRLSARSWLPYVMDLISLSALAVWYFVFFRELAQFRAGLDIVKADPHDVQILALPLIFVFVFLPLHIAIIWRNRAVQIAGWLCLYFGLIVGWILILFGGVFQNMYAGTEGYSHCFNDSGFAVYAHAQAVCPQIDAWRQQND
jgi:hypothetical protein